MTDIPNDLEALKAEHARLSKYLKDNALEKSGTPEHRKAVIAHRLLTDLIDRGGGSPEDRAYVMKKLNEPS